MSAQAETTQVGGGYSLADLYPAQPAGIRRRGGGPGRAGCAAADARARSALPDRVRHAPERAAHLPRGAGSGSRFPGGAPAGTCLGPGVSRGRDEPGVRGVGRDRRPVPRGGPAARCRRHRGPGQSDVGHDGAPLPCRVAWGPAGAGRHGAAGTTGPQDARRNRRTGGGRGGDRPGARPRAAVAAAGTHRAGSSRRHRQRDRGGRPRPDRLRHRRVRPERGQAAPSSPPTGC